MRIRTSAATFPRHSKALRVKLFTKNEEKRVKGRLVHHQKNI